MLEFSKFSKQRRLQTYSSPPLPSFSFLPLHRSILSTPATRTMNALWRKSSIRARRTCLWTLGARRGSNAGLRCGFRFTIFFEDIFLLIWFVVRCKFPIKDKSLCVPHIRSISSLYDYSLPFLSSILPHFFSHPLLNFVFLARLNPYLTSSLRPDPTVWSPW